MRKLTIYLMLAGGEITLGVMIAALPLVLAFELYRTPPLNVSLIPNLFWLGVLILAATLIRAIVKLRPIYIHRAEALASGRVRELIVERVRRHFPGGSGVIYAQDAVDENWRYKFGALHVETLQMATGEILFACESVFRPDEVLLPNREAIQLIPDAARRQTLLGLYDRHANKRLVPLFGPTIGRRVYE